MNRIKEKVKQAAKVVISNMVDQDAREWPPSCLIMAYQPMRPYRNLEDESQIINKPASSSARED